MVRGCQKRIYYIKDPRSSLFAEAYFVLKNREGSAPGEGELAAEAQRIVSDFDRNIFPHPHKSHHTAAGRNLGAFVIGAASSSAVIGGIALLLALA
ncbi:MAG: hypothetical protein IJB52_06100 [Clostridia bacterium]|nr:hypothetical protein [Clostridia bacterium]